MTPAQETSERELLACPFCGKAPKCSTAYSDGGAVAIGFECPDGCSVSREKPSYDKAVAVWNTRAAGDAPAWQPIKTAPADVQLLLGWWREWPILEWEMTAEQYSNTKGGWRHSWATHWMPLPAPFPRPDRLPVQPDTDESIPAGVFFQFSEDNFIAAATGKSCGGDFYRKWRPRWREFPPTAAALTPQDRSGA